MQVVAAGAMQQQCLLLLSQRGCRSLSGWILWGRGAAALRVIFFRFRRNGFSREGDDSAGMGNGGMLVYVAALLGFASKHQLLLIRQRPEQAAGERQDEGLRMLEGAWQKLLCNHRPGFANLYGNSGQSAEGERRRH